MDARKQLVVVLPGIGGSVLAGPGPGPAPASGDRRRILWDAGFASLLRLRTSAHRLSLAETPETRPVGLIRSHAVVPGWSVVRGYERLLARLSRLPGARLDEGDPEARVEDANIAAFPYDFRLGIEPAAHALAADVHRRLERLGWDGEPNRVIVIAHSMGGLVARYWLGPLGGRDACRALVTLGTPALVASARHPPLTSPAGAFAYPSGASTSTRPSPWESSIARR